MRGYLRGLLGALLVLALVLIGLSLSLPAHGQLIMPDGSINTECGPTPRDPPLPVPPMMVPANGDLPGHLVVTSSSTVPPSVDLPTQLGGTGTRALVDFNAKGVTVGWWVPRVGSVKLYLYGASWAHLAKNPGLVARLLLLAIMPNADNATLAGIGMAYPPTLHVLDMCDVWNPIAGPLNAIRPGPLPDPPPPPTVSYVVTGTVAYPLTATGGRSITPIAEKPILGSTCDCAKKEIISTATGARYCAVTIPNVTQMVVAGCSLKRQ